MNDQTIKETRTTLEEIASKLCAESELLQLMKDVLETPQYHGVPNAGAMEILLEQIADDLNELSNELDAADLKIGRALKAKAAEAAAS